METWTQEFQPFAKVPTPGSADLCIMNVSMVDIVKLMNEKNVDVEEGPVVRI